VLISEMLKKLQKSSTKNNCKKNFCKDVNFSYFIHAGECRRVVTFVVCTVVNAFNGFGRRGQSLCFDTYLDILKIIAIKEILSLSSNLKF
jgi:hypothetical protein